MYWQVLSCYWIFYPWGNQNLHNCGIGGHPVPVWYHWSTCLPPWSSDRPGSAGHRRTGRGRGLWSPPHCMCPVGIHVNRSCTSACTPSIINLMTTTPEKVFLFIFHYYLTWLVYSALSTWYACSRVLKGDLLWYWSTHAIIFSTSYLMTDGKELHKKSYLSKPNYQILNLSHITHCWR